MGALADLIANARQVPVLDDDKHREIAEARALNPPITWVAIAKAIAEETGGEVMPRRTIQTQHEAWLRRQ